MIARLDGFDAAIAHAQAATVAQPSRHGLGRRGARRVTIDDLLIRLPQGMPLVAADDIVIAPGERVLVTGPSGAGKSTLFRAIAGAGRSASGTVTVPKGAKLMMLPQRPYFPLGTLAAAVSYPAEPGTFGDERLAETVAAVGLAGARRPAATRKGTGTGCLSLGEQQRLGIARAILQAPDYSAARRSHRLARRGGGGGALSADRAAAAKRHDDLDRAPLDPCGLPPPRPCAGPEWQRAGAVA